MELREERVQRLQDLEEIYAKDKRLDALAAEMVQQSQLFGFFDCYWRLTF